MQAAAIEPVLAGEHALLLLAPTAGGKTEAAILPVFSRMLAEDWRGLSVVYVCPIKALLNNLGTRLAGYAGLFGRRVAVWHGDIPSSERQRTAREPPDLLLATPESLEVVLVSRRVDHRAFFRELRVIVVDEIHAFAGDDRGWHLIGLLDRLGRLAGRVPQRNCLFLAAALLALWRQGYVEPVEPPPLPYPVLAQQQLALALQESGVGRGTWAHWVPGLLTATGIEPAAADRLTAHMLAGGMLFDDGGVLGIGTEGEARYGLKHFLELFSVFSGSPLFTVWHGRSELGQVHPQSFHGAGQGPTVLALGGRQWLVEHVDWHRRRAFVKPAEAASAPGRSRWLGTGQPLRFALCQALKALLVTDTAPAGLSRRAATRLATVRDDFAWLRPDATSLVGTGKLRWWTFAGGLANAVYVRMLGELGLAAVADDLCVTTPETGAAADAIRQVAAAAPGYRQRIEADELARLARSSKFLDCVPPTLATAMLAARQTPRDALRMIASQPITRLRSG